jgi:beta-glucosidase
LIISKTDHQAQEDALRIQWTSANKDQVRIKTSSTGDFARQSNGAMELAFTAKSFTPDAASVSIGMCNTNSDCDKTLTIAISSGQWEEYRVSLSCFEKLGIDMTDIETVFMIAAGEGVDIGLGNIRLESDIDAKPGCDGR